MATTAIKTATSKPATAKKSAAKKVPAKKATTAKKAAVVESPASAPAQAAAPNWYEIMESALAQPGDLALTMKFMRQYSLSNRVLASMQLARMGQPMQPINTFNNWKKLNRMVSKGQKALALIMPVPVHFKKKDEEDEDAGGKKTIAFTKFMLRNHWFALSQTEGDEFVLPEVEGQEWNLKAGMAELQIAEHEFQFLNPSDRRQGEAVGKSIAISPLADDPQIARIREIARIMLGHTDNEAKGVPTESWLRDLEAEAATYLCAASVNLENLAHSRGIVQLALAEGNEKSVPAKNLHRAFAAADKIINAGYC